MPRRFGFVAILVMLAACGSSAARTGAITAHGASTSPGTNTARCGPASAKTLAAGRTARVYVLGRTVYGCALQSSKVFQLGSATTCLGAARVDGVAVNGNLVAYGHEVCGIDTGSTEILVRRLTDGRQLLSEPAVTGALGAESYESVGSIVVQNDGAVAWVASGRSIVGHGPSLLEVHSAGKGGLKLLDSGPGIAAKSLRLQGSTLTWLHSGQKRSAFLR